MSNLKRLLEFAAQTPEGINCLLTFRAGVCSLWNIPLSHDECIVLNCIPMRSLLSLLHYLPASLEPKISIESIIAKASADDEFFHNLLLYKGEIGLHFNIVIDEQDKMVLNSAHDDQLALMVQKYRESQNNWLPIYNQISISAIALLFEMTYGMHTKLNSGGFMSGGIRPGDRERLKATQATFENIELSVEYSGMGLFCILDLIAIETNIKISRKLGESKFSEMTIQSTSYKKLLMDYLEDIRNELIDVSVIFSYEYKEAERLLEYSITEDAQSNNSDHLL